jgi:hypothetical protein
MIHDSTWLERTRVRRTGAQQIVRMAPLGLLLACMLLAGFASTAAATTYDMRGEWSLEFKSKNEPTVVDTGIIDKYNEGTGEFSGTFHAGASGGNLEAKLQGTLSGTTVSLTTSTTAPFGTVTFVCKEEATLNTTTNTLTGTGAYYLNGNFSEAGEVSGRRLKSHQEIVEQEERERKEREEQRLREEVRGEWEITVGSGTQSFKGIALITQSANSKDEFVASSAVYSGVNPGTFSGKLEGATTSVEVTTPPYPPASVPGTTFTSKAMLLEYTANSMAISGSGTFAVEGGPKFSTTMTATRIKTYGQVVERETAEREAKEKQEREEREATEKAEREAKEKAEREAKEKHEREEREALEKAKVTVPLKTPLPIIPPSNPLVPVLLAAKTLSVGHSGALSLKLENPGASPEHGLLKLTLAKAGKASSSKHPSGTLGQSSFTIAAHGSEVVTVKLSKSARAQLARHKTLKILATITTEAAGQPTTTKTYTITLHATKAAHGKH